MQNTPRSFTGQAAADLEPLLAARGLTLDWLNSQTDDPYEAPVLARRAYADAMAVIPRIFRTARPALPETCAWIDAVVNQALADQKDNGRVVASAIHGPSLFLLGPTGVGKTHEAFGAMRQLAITGIAIRWEVMTAADLYASLRPRHGVDSEAEFRKVRDARVLLLDDLGAAKNSEFTEDVNFRLINHRYENEMPTLFTSNLTAPELTGRLGDRVASRLIEMCQPVAIKGSDRRRVRAA